MLSAVKPRHWIAGYDEKFLVVPLLLALCVAGILWLPAPKPTPQRITPVVPPPMAPTLVLQPPPGSVVTANVPFTLSGSAEPGSLVRLFYLKNGQEMFQREMTTTNGIWSFGITLGPTSYTFRTAALKGGRVMLSPETTYVGQTPPRQPAPKKPTPAKPTRKK